MTGCGRSTATSIPGTSCFVRGQTSRSSTAAGGALGDPADDVASLAVNFLFFALRTRGDFSGPFAELFRLFWDRYRERSGDDDLASVIAPHFAFRGLVVASPLWYPRESEDLRRKIFRFLLSVLEAERFEIDRIAQYLDRACP